jgi:hypothetical protein
MCNPASKTAASQVVAVSVILFFFCKISRLFLKRQLLKVKQSRYRPGVA